jgi:hypothetical protein
MTEKRVPPAAAATGGGGSETNQPGGSITYKFNVASRRKQGHRAQSAKPCRRQPEAAIHRAVCDHLHLRAKPGVLWLHVPNGEKRDKVTGAKLRRMGVLAGASDFLFWHQGNSFALELKGPGGRHSDAQLEFLARFNDAGGHSACAEGLDRALACLSAWGLLKGKVR